MHFHPELEILFVMQGEIQLTMSGLKQTLKKEDVVLINSNVLHSVRGIGGTLVGRARFSRQVISGIMRNERIGFLCNSAADHTHSYYEVRSIFHELIYLNVRGNHRTTCMQDSLLYRLLDCLIENYQIQVFSDYSEELQDERIQRIIHYVNEHYQSGISLAELADLLYVSQSTLSRLFKKQTGIYFAEYVNQVRMQHALNDLLYTDKNVTEIAMDSGFSNPSGFNKVFRGTYGTAPSEYRERLQKDIKKAEQKKEELLKELRKEFKMELPEKETLPTVRKDTRQCFYVDMEKRTDYEKIWNKVINIGALANMTLANLQYHVLMLAEQLDFSYVRLWNVFSKRLMITDGSAIGKYNYDNVNTVLDFLVSHHIKPYLDFGKRPDTLTIAEGKSAYFEDECVMFASRRAWESIMEDFVVHLIKRYGKTEVESWIFEFSFNRIHEKESAYYADDRYDYFEVFRYGLQMIKSYLPDVKVGGFSGIIHLDYAYMKQFLVFCKANACIPDYVSFLLFPYKTTGKKYRRVYDERFEEQEIEQIYEVMRDAKLDRNACEIYLTEWNVSLSNRNYVNDSCFRATYFVKDITSIWERVDLMSVWVGSDWIGSRCNSQQVANGGGGLLTQDTIRKPAFYALQFLNMMGSGLVEKGRNYIITRNWDHDFYILCFYHSWFGYDYFTKEENELSLSDMDHIFQNEGPIELEFELQNLPSNGRYMIRTRSVGHDHGSILDEWKMLGYETNIESSDVKYLREVCIPHLTLEKQEAYGNRLRIRRTLQVHELSLIHIYEESYHE